MVLANPRNGRCHFALQVADWELNFKVLKSAARDAERLPNEVKVSCREQCVHQMRHNLAHAAIKSVVDNGRTMLFLCRPTQVNYLSISVNCLPSVVRDR